MRAAYVMLFFFFLMLSYTNTRHALRHAAADVAALDLR